MRKKPTIAFFGSSLVSAYWNGAATYYRGIIRGLAARGFDITFYEPDAYDRQQHRDIPDPDWARVVVYPARDEAGQQGVWRALEQSRHADVIVKTSGVGVFDELLDAAVLDAKAPHATAIFWDVDAPATLDRLAADPGDPFHRLVPRYDMVLTYGGGDPVVRGYRGVGARLCMPIYNALDPDTHFVVPADPRFAADLGFLGNRLPDREARVEQFLFAAAERLRDSTFVLGGNGWSDKRRPNNIHYVGHVYTRDHNSFNCSTLAVLNISRESMARYGYSPATRVFEAAGAGACLITDEWLGIEMFLEPDREVLVARDGDHVADHLVALDPERARAIGQAARRRILTEHTYSRRAAELDLLLDAKAVA
jgi:spore maturation protein CgeB